MRKNIHDLLYGVAVDKSVHRPNTSNPISQPNLVNTKNTNSTHKRKKVLFWFEVLPTNLLLHSHTLPSPFILASNVGNCIGRVVFNLELTCYYWTFVTTYLRFHAFSVVGHLAFVTFLYGSFSLCDEWGKRSVLGHA